ncbi:MAG: undecaprenyldiphospho-muramoylpentapeptide beta-N-acetylglucosaminyltransferase [Paludibacter sp.]|jgi:UDP-N-acetylglucosamine--N-acetylmuramyl-(pentapeptide) pyrophosphoryl-undecaprenol N-acetylglucosamine transferase|nr:undecaprenyldiphospho-muramoylpentapeptide beta-N-acetylglucosaminyltransferase [Paludibacter sp.]
MKNNQNAKQPARIIISGGGTGGHIFPAISIANALREQLPDADILFVGALGRMEMERVPQAGYRIEGLPVRGFDRKNLLKNIPVLIDLLRSMLKARTLIRNFRPEVAIGVGGYASGPILKAAAAKGIPTVLQEQNSYAGVTNKLLAQKAALICVAYDGMERFFPAGKLVKTGNPVRSDLLKMNPKAPEAYEFFGLSASKPTLLIIGGSLGARTINQSVIGHLEALKDSGVQVIWQTGKFYIDEARASAAKVNNSLLLVTDFISRMDYAFSVADLVISRAGAGTISELCLLAKPVILVPSPNVAEDHQTKNALALVEKEAAVLVKDAQAREELIPRALELMPQVEKLKKLSENILLLAEENSAGRIALQVMKILKR